jgi:hypothetical protein
MPESSTIDMGGMFAILKVRENLTSYEDPGWYENPPGTLASVATDEELQRDLGINPGDASRNPDRTQNTRNVDLNSKHVAQDHSG